MAVEEKKSKEGKKHFAFSFFFFVVSVSERAEAPFSALFFSSNRFAAVSLRLRDGLLVAVLERKRGGRPEVA